MSATVDRWEPRKPSSVHDVAAAVKGRRLDLGLSQGDLVPRAGVQRDSINWFERGNPAVEVARVLSVLDTLGLRLDLDEGGVDDCYVVLQMGPSSA
jgi:ribosome-binding protein aMBF1 (putative translation factor)